MRRLRLWLVVFAAVSALQALALSQANIPAAAAYVYGLFHTVGWVGALYYETTHGQ
ncbi:hypothetical protein [Chromohalobacter israelensis]|uniref:hypothetical protein n=1 Tax=Chromohalobacter israelensis TaxID=141390 RepID=UPI00265C73CF|nr:hypothetical protein [Chromohalobacter salexigens]MDO0944633.1 hypothetical protein [Chromohalobacter salexigens]